MKSSVLTCLFALVAIPAFAQHGGGGGGVGGGAGAGGHGGMAPAPSGSFGARGGFGVTGGRFRSGVGLRPFGFRRFHQGYSPYAYPLLYDGGYGDYGYGYGYGGYDYEYPPEPNVTVVQPPAPQVIIQPAPVRSEIHDYRPAPEVLPAPSAPAEETTFVIALNDGSRLSANAVWVQDNMLHYIDPDDRHQQISIRSVDRQLTRRINRERKLDLWLPAAQ